MIMMGWAHFYIIAAAVVAAMAEHYAIAASILAGGFVLGLFARKE